MLIQEGKWIIERKIRKRRAQAKDSKGTHIGR